MNVYLTSGPLSPTDRSVGTNAILFLTGETTKAYEKPSIPGTTTQPVTLTQALAIPVAEATHRATSKPFAASITSSPRPQPVGYRNQEMGK